MTAARLERRKARRPSPEASPSYLVRWYSENPGAECFGITDRTGKLVAQMKIFDDRALTEAVIAMLAAMK